MFKLLENWSLEIIPKSYLKNVMVNETDLKIYFVEKCLFCFISKQIK